MPIRIKCPKCQTILGVKESLAGKKANCPKCRYLLTIPIPKVAAAKPEDAEALAASLFADEPAPVKAVETRFVEFECPFCVEKVKVSADMAGKQVPCPNPECKRIVKVPLPKEDKPKDWRQVGPRGPSLAKKDDNVPEGTWSTAQKTRVSTEALLEADAIPVKREPVKVSTWVIRGVLALVTFLVLVGGAWGFFAWMANKRLMGALNGAVEYVEPTSKLKPAPTAEIHRGAGEFLVMRDNAAQAMYHFNKARGLLNTPLPKGQPSDPERDVLLIELALTLIELGGNEREVDNETRKSWGDIQTELERTLNLITTTEAKQTALREVANRLADKGETDLAGALVEKFGAEAPPKEDAPLLDDDGQPLPVQPKKGPPTPAARPLLAAQHIAWLVGKGEPAKATAIAAAPDPKNKDATLTMLVRLGYAEGNARQGNFEAARQIAGYKGKDLERLEASLGVAAVALGKKNAAEAKLAAQQAQAIYKEIRTAATPLKVPTWLLLQLTRVCARADLAADAKQIVNHFEKTDKSARGLAQLEILLAQLDATTEPVPLTIIDEHVTLKDTLAYSLAVEKVARHNTRLGRRSEALALADTLDDSHKAFVSIGVALGMLDAKR